VDRPPRVAFGVLGLLLTARLGAWSLCYRCCLQPCVGAIHAFTVRRLEATGLSSYPGLGGTGPMPAVRSPAPVRLRRAHLFSHRIEVRWPWLGLGTNI